MLAHRPLLHLPAGYTIPASGDLAILGVMPCHTGYFRTMLKFGAWILTQHTDMCEPALLWLALLLWCTLVSAEQLTMRQAEIWILVLAAHLDDAGQHFDPLICDSAAR